MLATLLALSGCGVFAVRSAESEVSRLESEVEALSAEVAFLAAHAPSRRPGRPRGRCLEPEELADGAALLQGASRRKGKAQGGGFELAAVPRGSFWAAARARPGDVVLSIAGVALERKPDVARAGAAVAAAGPVPVLVEIERAGARTTLAVDPWCR